MNTPILSPEQVWETALDQLRIDIPLNAFNNWLRGTQGVSFENNTFVVGTANTDVRELLESRLTSTASHLISGILGQPVSVQFVVQEKPDENELEGTDPTQADDPNPETPKVLTLQAEYQSVYDEIVQPDQVIVFPGYFLRYIPILGQELAWMYIGFRQAAYEAGAGRKPGKKVGAPAKKVARYAGMSLRTFWRWAAKPETWKLLRWLVEPVDEEPRWKKGSDGRPHRATRFYRVSMSLPLTPFDELSLRAWLYRKLAEGKSPLEAVRIALDTPVSELLPWPERILFIEENSHEPHTVQDLLSTICNPIAEADQKLFHELVEKLVHHLMPSKDLVFLTHYFVQHWLPQMGPGPGWFVTMMRDRCYLNLRTGEIRDEVRLEQGYSEAAQGLGLKRDKTIWEWLRSKEVATFVREIGREEGKWESAPRYFKVCLGEPMIPGDQERASRSLAGKAIGASDTHGDSSEEADIGAIGTVIGGNGSHPGGNGNHNDAVGTHGGGNGSQNSPNDDTVGASGTHIGTESAISSGTNGTFVGASDTHMVGANGTPIGAFGTIPWREWHSLNSLTLNKHFINTQTTPAKNEEIYHRENGEEVVGDIWNLADLLSRNRISPKTQQVLLDKGLKAPTFVSWLMYAASQNGSRIRDPVGHAVSRLIQNHTQGAGGAYDRLAALPVNKLADIIFQELEFQSPSNTDWSSVMEGVKHVRIRALADQLGVPVPNSIYG